MHRYITIAGVRVWHIVVPVVLALVVASTEVASLGLLVPLSRGMANDSLDNVWSLPVFSTLREWLPASFFAHPNEQALLAIGIVATILALRLFSIAVGYVHDLFLFRRNQRYELRIRKKTFRRMLGFGRGYFEQHSTGQSHMMLDWPLAMLRLLQAADELFINVVRLGGKITIMLTISWPLTVGMAVAFPVMQLLLGHLARAVRRVAESAGIEGLRIQREVYDLLSMIPLVKALSREKETVERYANTIDTMRTIVVKQERLRDLGYPIQEAVVLLTMFFVGGGLILANGDFHPGELARICAFLLVAQQSLPNFMAIHRLRVTYLEQGHVLAMLRTFHDGRGKYIVPNGKLPLDRVEEGISVRNLRFAYVPGKPVLHDVSAFFPAGTMTAIVGESGSGKSTLVDLIARFYHCPKGSIFIDGVDVHEFDLRSLHDGMTIASQDVWLLNRSLRDNLRFGLRKEASDTELLRVLGAVGLTDLLERLPEGLATEVGDRGVRLSGGERQRLALARGLLREPKVIILDEATAALDSVTEQRVKKEIAGFARGRTVIAIAHRLSTITMASRIFVMKEGRIVERGTWSELLALGGEFKRLYDAQQGAPLTVTSAPVELA